MFLSRIFSYLKVFISIVAIIVIFIQYQTIKSQSLEIETLMQEKGSLQMKLSQNRYFITQSKETTNDLFTLEKDLFGIKELKNDFIHQKDIHSRINAYITNNPK